MLYFSKLSLCLLQIGQALFEFGTKDLSLLAKPGILNGNRSGDHEGFGKTQVFLSRMALPTVLTR